jgi:glycosyltransferase involved in cell wall biosynthesis
MHRICLISPGHLCSNPRLVKEADALSAAGYEVVVITGQSFPAYASEAQTFSGRSWQVVARVPFGALAPRWLRWKQRLRQKLALALCRLGPSPQLLVLRAWHPAGPELIRAACAVRADLYIAHYPPALPAAALAARRHGAVYAFDAEDFHLGDWPEQRRFNLQRGLLRAIESRYLPGCAFLTAASPGIAEAYASTHRLPLPTVVRNTFPLAQAPPGPTPVGAARPGPSLYWFSQTIGPDRGLECAIQALPLAQCGHHLHLRGFLSPAYRAHLLDLARDLGVEQRLHVHPPAPPEQMERLAAAYDVGLVAETGRTPNHRIALANKLFTYALAGIPMVLSDIPAHRAIQAEAGEAVRLFCTEDPASLAEALDGWLHAPPAVLAQARQAAWQLGQDRWNWEQEQIQLLRRVEAHLASSRVG